MNTAGDTTEMQVTRERASSTGRGSGRGSGRVVLMVELAKSKLQIKRIRKKEAEEEGEMKF